MAPAAAAAAPAAPAATGGAADAARHPPPTPTARHSTPRPRAAASRCRSPGRNVTPGEAEAAQLPADDADRRPRPARRGRGRCRRPVRAAPQPAPAHRRPTCPPWPTRLAPAPTAAHDHDPGPGRLGERRRSRAASRSASRCASFAAAGGLRLERTTNVLIAMMLAGAGAVAAALLRRPRTAESPLYGGGPLLAFARPRRVHRALDHCGRSSRATRGSRPTARSPTSPCSPAASRSAACCPAAGRGWSPASALGCLLVCAWALLTKVFPASLAPDETYARLREPFAYWNSVGLMAALGVPPMLWLAARRSGHAAVNALAWPAMASCSSA